MSEPPPEEPTRAVAGLSATIAVLVVGGVVYAGAREWGRRRAFASALAEGDAALAAGDLPRALASANRAGEAGPGEPRAKALLSRVQAESAVRAGDEIVSVADAKYEEVDEVYAAILAMAPQQEYEVVVRRGNEEVRVKAKGPDFGARMGQAAPAPAGSDLARAAREARIGSVWRLPRPDANAVPPEGPSGQPRLGALGGRPRRAGRPPRLPKGAYLLCLPRGEGIYETRLPFEVSREAQEAETVALEPDSPPPLPPGVEETIGIDAHRYWVFVPAGRYRASGDPQARQNIARPASRRRGPLAASSRGSRRSPPATSPT